MSTIIGLNHFNNFQIESLAVGNDEKDLKMIADYQSNSGGFRAKSQFHNTDEFTVVKQVKLDNFFKNSDQINFIKVDVEGYEMEVLKGAEKIIQTHRPILVLELNDRNLKLQKSSALDVINWLNEKGYVNILNAFNSESLENFVFTDCCIDILCYPL